MPNAPYTVNTKHQVAVVSMVTILSMTVITCWSGKEWGLSDWKSVQITPRLHCSYMRTSMESAGLNRRCVLFWEGEITSGRGTKTQGGRTVDNPQ